MATIDFDDVRLSTAGGIAYKLLSMKGGESDESATATEVYVIRASNLDAFMIESFPTPQVIGNLIAISPRRAMPKRPFLVTKQVDFESVDDRPIDPFGNDALAPAGTYQPLVKLTIQYEIARQNEDDQPDENNPESFLEHSINAGAEYLHIPPKKVEISAKGIEEQSAADVFEVNKDPQLGAYKIIPTIEHSLRWKFVLKPAWTTIYQTLGKVNDAAIKVFNDAKPESVLFSGISGQQSYRYFRRTIQTLPWSLDFKFSQRCVFEANKTYGWNHVYSPNKNAWVKLRRQENNLFLYETADFLELFKAEED